MSRHPTLFIMPTFLALAGNTAARGFSVADGIVTAIIFFVLAASVYIVRSYRKGLRHSPRELWLLYGYKFIECVAYGAVNPVLTLWLTHDCGLQDKPASYYIAVYSVIFSAMNVVAGAFVDTAGIRRMTLVSVAMLIVSRLLMGCVTNPALVFVVGFIPMALGFAIVSPVVSIGVKRFTTNDGSPMGFALFYMIMNIGFAAGALVFDVFRKVFVTRNAEGRIVDEARGLEILGLHFSTYQLLFLFGTLATLVSLGVVLLMREGVEVNEAGETVVKKREAATKPSVAGVKDTLASTGRMIVAVARERFFWFFLTFAGLLMFVRSVYNHFHYTFPKYGIRVLGEGAPIGSVYGVLNPVLIVFLVPLIAALTKNVKSYTLIVTGSMLSAGALFLAIIPPHHFEWMTHTPFGEVIFVRWLGIAPDAAALATNPPAPMYWPLIFFITVFTIGEAIWSPRLYQFTTEIAPKGKEATYLSLAVLPTFASKVFVGWMSGELLDRYTPIDHVTKAVLPHPHQYMVWVWIGVSAAVTPIGLLVFKKAFDREAAATAK